MLVINPHAVKLPYLKNEFDRFSPFSVKVINKFNEFDRLEAKTVKRHFKSREFDRQCLMNDLVRVIGVRF